MLVGLCVPSSNSHTRVRPGACNCATGLNCWRRILRAPCQKNTDTARILRLNMHASAIYLKRHTQDIRCPASTPYSNGANCETTCPVGQSADAQGTCMVPQSGVSDTGLHYFNNTYFIHKKTSQVCQGSASFQVFSEQHAGCQAAAAAAGHRWYSWHHATKNCTTSPSCENSMPSSSGWAGWEVFKRWLGSFNSSHADQSDAYGSSSNCRHCRTNTIQSPWMGLSEVYSQARHCEYRALCL